MKPFLRPSLALTLAVLPLAGSAIDLMTQNQYLGADLVPVIGAAEDPIAFNEEVLSALSAVADNHFPRRAIALGELIAGRSPHVVGLQEVSRGWVLNGSMDTLTWLSQRLDMVPVFGAAADAQWGNAVLSKLPVESFENQPLPPDDLLLKRAFMALQLDQGTGKPLSLINTHYHNPSDGGAIREEQTATILEYWNDGPGTVIMGDFNAEHGMREVDMVTEAGFGDVLDLTGVAPGYTNPVPDPYRRIDYIFITPDLIASSAVVPPEEASDHLGIAVTITSNQ